MDKLATVMVFGTFDFLHVGHLDLFCQAKHMGERVVAVVSRDETVRRTKHHKPIFNEKERLRLVQSIREIDRAVLGHDYYRDKTEIILEHQPRIVLLGYDHKVNAQKLQSDLREKGWDGNVIRAKPYQSTKAKTSKIRKKIERTE